MSPAFAGTTAGFYTESFIFDLENGVA